jgi:hypothetical protein
VTLRAVEGATREGWYTPLLYGCRVLLNLMQQFLSVALPLLADGYNIDGNTAPSASSSPCGGPPPTQSKRQQHPRGCSRQDQKRKGLFVKGVQTTRIPPWHFSRREVLQTETPLPPSWAILSRNQHSCLISAKVVAGPVIVTATVDTD